MTRSELTYGTIDVVAPDDYSLKKPSKAHILFAIEISKGSVQTGAFMAYIQTIKEFLQNPLTKTHYSKVGIVTFDENIQFYDLRRDLMEPQVLVMSDIMDPFVPIMDGLFFDPTESLEIALSLLEKLPKLLNDTRIIESCFGSTVVACIEALVFLVYGFALTF